MHKHQGTDNEHQENGADNPREYLIWACANGLFPATPENRFIHGDWQSLNALVQLIYQHQPPWWTDTR